MDGVRKMLIIQACGLEGEDAECQNIKTQAELYGLEVQLYKPADVRQFTQALYEDKWHYIYISCHGNEEGICSDDSAIQLQWSEIAELICWSCCMESDCKILLSCCRGGLNTVAYELMSYCHLVSYVIGPRQKLGCEELLAAFNLFLYLTAFRDTDPVVACEKVVKATDLRLICFDRLELESDLAYLKYKEAIELEWENQSKDEILERNKRLIDYGIDPEAFVTEEEPESDSDATISEVNR